MRYNFTVYARSQKTDRLGGGFAGIYTARALERLLGPDEADICLVNRENYWVYQPMLPEVISGSIATMNVVCPIRRLCPRTQPGDARGGRHRSQEQDRDR